MSQLQYLQLNVQHFINAVLSNQSLSSERLSQHQIHTTSNLSQYSTNPTVTPPSKSNYAVGHDYHNLFEMNEENGVSLDNFQSSR